MQSAHLDQGTTAYEVLGEGPLLVLIHGLSTPAFVWDAMLPHLHKAGFSTLRYDLYGRGGSAAFHKRYDGALYTQQLFDLLDQLEITNPVHIMGYSMGGGIATLATAEQPKRVKSLTLLAPTGFKTQLEESWPILKIPFYGPIHMEMFGGSQIRMSARAEAAALGLTSNIGELQAQASYKPGFMRAVRKSIKEGPIEGLESTHAKIAATDTPVLSIWSDQDKVIPISGRTKLAEINPKAEQVTIENATHALAYTHEEQIAELVTGFIARL